MNLIDLFEMQKAREAEIVEQRGLHGQDLIPQKVLALQSSLGKVADAWRGHMYWSDDQEPRTNQQIEVTHADYRKITAGEMEWPTRNPLLERYVEALGFMLSIAIEAGYQADELDVYDLGLQGTPVDQMNELFMALSNFKFQRKPEHKKQWFRSFWYIFWNFGDQQLEFDFDEIAEAYVAKNATNHQRQQTGY